MDVGRNDMVSNKEYYISFFEVRALYLNLFKNLLLKFKKIITDFKDAN